MCHSGCFAEDLIRLMMTSVTASVRRQNTAHFLHYYIDSLTSKLGYQPITFDQLQLAYKHSFRVSILY